MNNHIPGHLLLLIFPLNNPSVRSLECRKRSACKRLSIIMVISRPNPASTFDVTIACFSMAWTSIEPLLLGITLGWFCLPIRYNKKIKCKNRKKHSNYEKKIRKNSFESLILCNLRPNDTLNCTFAPYLYSKIHFCSFTNIFGTVA